MAIAYVSTTNCTVNQNQTSISQSVTVSAGTDRLLVCCVHDRDSNASRAVNSVVFNTSEAFTKIRHDARGSGPFWRTEIWYLVNPSVTTANVLVTWAAGCDGGQAFSVIYLTGVDGSNPVDAHNGANGSGTTLSVNITTVAADAWIVDSAIGQDDAGLTVGSGQTARVDRNIGVGVTEEGVGVSTVNGKASPGSETMDWTQTSANWCITAASFKPTAAASALVVSGLTSSLLLNSRLKRSFVRG